jgi:hypothetical protein
LRDRGRDVSWRIVIVEEMRYWLHELRRTDRDTLLSIAAAIDVLEAGGPSLGRPLVDTIRGSKLANLKELRPGSSGSSEVRILFIFDPDRAAVLLVGGDKSSDWEGWYDGAIPEAEQRYEDYRNSVEKKNENNGKREAR